MAPFSDDDRDIILTALAAYISDREGVADEDYLARMRALHQRLDVEEPPPRARDAAGWGDPPDAGLLDR